MAIATGVVSAVTPDQQLDIMVVSNQITTAFREELASTVKAVLGEFRVVAGAVQAGQEAVGGIKRQVDEQQAKMEAAEKASADQFKQIQSELARLKKAVQRGQAKPKPRRTGWRQTKKQAKAGGRLGGDEWLQGGEEGKAVSYTHLTLPTICSV
eukprot:5806830-Alexandrium_andersonii.AAC.1